MAPKKQSTSPRETPSPNAPEVSAEGYAYGRGDHSWSIQGIMEIQRTLGTYTEKLANIERKLDAHHQQLQTLALKEAWLKGGLTVAGVLLTAALTIGGWVISGKLDRLSGAVSAATDALKTPAPSLPTYPMPTPQTYGVPPNATVPIPPAQPTVPRSQ